MWGIRIKFKSGKNFIDMCSKCYQKAEEHTKALKGAHILQKPLVVAITKCYMCEENWERENWLFENQEALESVKSGLKQASEGKTKSRGSFSNYLDNDDNKNILD